MSDMIDSLYSDIVEREIQNAMDSMFPHGAGNTTHTRVQHHLNVIAKMAFESGKSYALLGLMTANDVAAHFDITPTRARALIAHRHKRFGVGMKFGSSWLVQATTSQRDVKTTAMRRKKLMACTLNTR